MSDSPDQGSYVVLWAGENPSVHVNLLDKLEANGIPYNDKTLGDDSVAPTSDTLPIDWKPRFGFEVTVNSVDYPAAQQLLESLLDDEPEDVEIPAQPEVVDPAAGNPAANDQPASVAVWRGSDEKLTQFLTSALAENSLAARVESDGTLAIIFVSPANEARAAEIVREVTQGAPPA
jgi:hypothetical protein